MITCAICNTTVPNEDIFTHLWDNHQIHEEWERWDDGGFIIYEPDMNTRDIT